MRGSVAEATPYLFLLPLILPSLLLLLLTQPVSSFDHCNLIDNCNECLQNYSECAWCSDPEWEFPHCFVAGAWYLGNATCNLLTNYESTVTVTEMYELTDTNQVTPTKFKLNLRAKQPVSQIIMVRPAKGYPIDSYYLMDFSYSMKDDLENLVLLAGNLTEEFKRVSENYTIGFGTFIDKNVNPYSYRDPQRIDNPCYTDTRDRFTGEEISCPPTYSFKNEMSLEASLEKFEKTLKSLEVSSNIDFPEGGFEALLQVASCWQKLGFRKKSRKIVIYASDAGIHIAGDGKLAGLVNRNDGQCYIDSNTGYYTRAEYQDYPSIEQVNQMLINNNIIPIFAIEKEYLELYQELSDHMTQLSNVGKLSADSSNIVELVRDALYRVTSTINLVILDTLGYKVEIEPLCDEQIPNGCTGVKYGETVDFKVTFTLEKCEELKYRKVLPIIVPGFETIFVEIEHQCGCNCYDNIPVERNEDVCSNHGDNVCGTCACRDPYYGENCECSPYSTKSDELCKAPGSNMVCSQQGRCECGKCICRNPQTPPGVDIPYVRYGEFCECSNYECPKGANGKLCSGLGNCHCGTCYCNQTTVGVAKEPTTEGEACDCELSTEKCFDPNPDSESKTGHLMCNGPMQGECQCNRCICKPNYRGRYCEECIFCGPLDCATHSECVLCLAVKKQKAEDPEEIDCTSKCEGNGVTYVGVDPVVDPDQLIEDGWTLEKQCLEYDDDEYDCQVNFYIASRNVTALTLEESLNITVFYDIEINCDEFALIWIILLIVGAIVLAGLLFLLLWKCWSMYQDRKLYAQFEEEMAAAKWNTTQSPIYKKATTVHANPLFAH